MPVRRLRARGRLPRWFVPDSLIRISSGLREPPVALIFGRRGRHQDEPGPIHVHGPEVGTIEIIRTAHEALARSLGIDPLNSVIAALEPTGKAVTPRIIRTGGRALREAGMGLYSERVLPRIVNIACGSKNAKPLRQRVCEGLAGDIVEIGFGSGLNVPFYQATVTRVAAVEPSDVAWKLGERRLRAATVPVERAGLDGQSLPFADHSFDAAVSCWTLCTIPDVAAALQEVRRVLKPGATLHFVEHGLGPD
jgi:SAM-dependent methyltransferase